MLNEYQSSDEVKPVTPPAIVIDKLVLYRAYIKHFKYIAVLSFIALLVTLALVKVKITPTYRSNCFVIRSPKNMSTPVEMPYLYQTFDINTLLETVRTRDVLLGVIQKLDLGITPEALFRSVDVQRGNRSNVLKFTATWNDPEMVAKIANTLAESFIEHNTHLLNSATLKIYNYYTNQQKVRLANIQDLELQYEQFRAKYGVISVPQETQAKFDQLKEVELKMIENHIKITEMDSKIAEMGDKLRAVPPEVVMTWTYTQTDERKLLELEKELEILRSKYTDENPKIQKIIKEIQDLKQVVAKAKRDLPDAVTWGPSGLTDTYTVDKTRFEAERKASIEMNLEYQKKVEVIKASLENLTQIQKDFFEVERQLALNRDILRLVEGRLAEAKMAMQSNVSDYEILETATPPNYPEGTNRKLIVFAMAFLVFGAGSLLVLGKEVLDVHTKSPKDYSDAVRIPLIGNLPDETQVDKQVFYRNLQVMVDNVIRINEGKKQPFICIGSDIQETGKSFLVKEIIRMLSGQGKRVLYIDSIHHVSAETEPYLVNGWVYGMSDTRHLDTKNPLVHYGFFLADDSTFTAVFEQSRLESLIQSFEGYDYILWELFDFHYNIQLFTSIATASDSLFMVGRFRRSSRNAIAKLVAFVKERKQNRIFGVLNYVHKDYYQEKY